MGFNTPRFRTPLIYSFGQKLAVDRNFKLTSEPTYKYNCIAFAMGMDDRWVDTLDVPWHWWPPVQKDETPESLVKAFEYLGFEKCDMDDSMADEYDKVVLYKGSIEWLHAARVVGENVYHSKFGENCDGTHSGGDILLAKYGLPYQVMRRLKTDAHLTDDRKGPFVGHSRLSKKLKFFINVDGHQGVIEDSVTLYKGKMYLESHGNEIVLSSDKKSYQILPKVKII